MDQPELSCHGLLCFCAWNPHSTSARSQPLRLATVAVVFHAARVAIYVFRRTGPWRDFDSHPEHRRITSPKRRW